MKRLLYSAAVILLSSFAGRADAPGVYAIRDARIVTAAGPPIESGTLVIRGGIVESVGASIAAPVDAVTLDGKGLTVYPGLIDLGNSHVAEQPAPQPPQNMKTTAELERWKRAQILRPQARAADVLKADEAEIAKLAAAGITSILATPSGEVISGQSALANVAARSDEPQIGNIVDERHSLTIVKTPVALHVSFPTRPRAGSNAYPTSLMGVIAFVRQAFLDAQQYAGTRGHETSEDPALEAMRPAIERRIPVAFEANHAREILRAIKMARDLKLDPIITGARNAGEVAADLKAQNVRVVYSLKYPERPKELAPDADESIAVLRERADAPKMPGVLARAGVGFAFSSSGLNDPKAFVANAAKAVKAGLPKEAAIRALTIDAATIAGVADRLGTIEKGKIANIIVTDGDLFEEKTKVTRVFIDGRPVALSMGESPGRSR